MPSDSPQVEAGFVRIANELHDAILLAGLSKRELLVMFAVIRKTYGYGKKSDDMTMTQLAAATALKLPHVSDTVRDLEAKGLLSVAPGTYGKVIGVVKNYRTWKREVTKTVSRKVTETVSNDITETVTPEVTESVSEDYRNGNSGLPKQSFEVTETVNTKDNPKRQLQKTTPKESCAAPTAPTWESYSNAYQNRYGVPPVRNAKVSGQVARLIDRIGFADAPPVAAFYVQSNAAYYVRCGHSVGALLTDCEKLRTEWATGNRITDTAARRADATQAQGDVWGGLIAEAEAREKRTASQS